MRTRWRIGYAEVMVGLWETGNEQPVPQSGPLQRCWTTIPITASQYVKWSGMPGLVNSNIWREAGWGMLFYILTKCRVYPILFSHTLLPYSSTTDDKQLRATYFSLFLSRAALPHPGALQRCWTTIPIITSQYVPWSGMLELVIIMSL